jgi:hypothetical protein
MLFEHIRGYKRIFSALFQPLVIETAWGQNLTDGRPAKKSNFSAAEMSAYGS